MKNSSNSIVSITLLFSLFQSSWYGKETPEDPRKISTFVTIETKDHHELKIPLVNVFFSTVLNHKVRELSKLPHRRILTPIIELDLDKKELEEMLTLFDSILETIAQKLHIKKNHIHTNDISQNSLLYFQDITTKVATSIQHKQGNLFVNLARLLQSALTLQAPLILDILLSIFTHTLKLDATITEEKIQIFNILPHELIFALYSHLLCEKVASNINKREKLEGHDILVNKVTDDLVNIINSKLAPSLFLFCFNRLLKQEHYNYSSSEEKRKHLQQLTSHFFTLFTVLADIIEEEEKNPHLFRFLKQSTNPEKDVIFNTFSIFDQYLRLSANLLFTTPHNHYSSSPFSFASLFVEHADSSLLHNFLKSLRHARKEFSTVSKSTIKKLGFDFLKIITTVRELMIFEQQFQQSWIKQVLPETTARKVYYYLKKRPSALLSGAAIGGVTISGLIQLYRKYKAESGN